VTALFVYGSLKRFEPNHRLLGDSAFLECALTEPRFTLFDLGAYPAMTMDGDMQVEGEIYEVGDATLARLDQFEGHPSYYERVAIPIVGHDDVEGYVFRATLPVDAKRIIGGRWSSSSPITCAERARGPRRS